MQIPHFPESHHPIIQSLVQQTDHDLLMLFQRHPEEGRYFTALFCRYHSIVYTLIHHSVRSPVQADYLFAITWRHIYYELRGLNVSELIASQSAQGRAQKATFNLQTWLVNITAVCINHAKLPPVESIHYSLQDASPPLWCYLDQALNQLPPHHRFAVLMAQTFRWSKTRIAAYLRAEQVPISANEVDRLLAEGYQNLCGALPQDICQIYQIVEHPDPSMANAEVVQDEVASQGAVP